MADLHDSGKNVAGVKVMMYATGWCPYCRRAESLLRDKGVAFDWIDVEDHPGRREEMMRLSGRRTVPQIWIGEQHVGGCDDLFALEQSGQLDAMLSV
jgi:glutaredoxin 3